MDQTEIPQEIVTEFPEDIVQAVAAGRKIEAVRLLRARTGMSLAEAKQAIEQLERKLRGDAPSAPTMKEEGGAEGLIRLVIAIAALAAIYWFVLRDAAA